MKWKIRLIMIRSCKSLPVWEPHNCSFDASQAHLTFCDIPLSAIARECPYCSYKSANTDSYFVQLLSLLLDQLHSVRAPIWADPDMRLKEYGLSCGNVWSFQKSNCS